LFLRYFFLKDKGENEEFVTIKISNICLGIVEKDPKKEGEEEEKEGEEKEGEEKESDEGSDPGSGIGSDEEQNKNSKK
jgi:hypothetical protein